MSFNPRRIVPQPGGQLSHVGEAGPALSPEEASAQRRVDGVPDPRRPLIPTAKELAKLPREARAAFGRRCAARVCQLRPAGSECPAELDPAGTALLIVTAATAETPIRRQLRCIRRDFDRLLRLAREHNWTDDTPVPAEVFGPMWPTGLVPEWSRADPGEAE